MAQCVQRLKVAFAVALVVERQLVQRHQIGVFLHDCARLGGQNLDNATVQPLHLAAAQAAADKVLGLQKAQHVLDGLPIARAQALGQALLDRIGEVIPVAGAEPVAVDLHGRAAVGIAPGSRSLLGALPELHQVVAGRADAPVRLNVVLLVQPCRHATQHVQQPLLILNFKNIQRFQRVALVVVYVTHTQFVHISADGLL